MTTLVYQFSESGILIKSTAPHTYSFTFDGTEEQFAAALLQVMDNYGYEKQHDDWFPSKPVEDDENAMYYIQLPDESLFITFDYVNKECCIM